ncbi:MAG: universal stress protein [Thermodesulfobacteriota bacterium]
MFRNILVPVDFSEENLKAAAIAAQLAGPYQGTVTLLHVIETIAGADFLEIKDFYVTLEKKAQAGMDRLLEAAAGAATQKSKIVFGNRVGEILKFASERKCDLIVLSSHKIRPEDPVSGWGTISYKVGILAQCPVLLVK